MAENNWVWMEHPEMPETEPVSVTENAFLEVWSDKGWTLTEFDEEEAAAEALSIDEGEDNTTDEESDEDSDDEDLKEV